MVLGILNPSSPPPSYANAEAPSSRLQQ